jgi:glycine/D-amino acid oxidase-like deaminating enzyme
LEVAVTERGVDRLKTRCETAKQFGLPAELIASAIALDVASKDLLKAEDVAIALHFATDGTAYASAITTFYQNEARRKGVEFREGVVSKVNYDPHDNRVTGVQVSINNTDSGAATTTETIQTETVILAAVIWTQGLSKDLEFPVPVVPVAHPYMYVGHYRPQDKDEKTGSLSPSKRAKKTPWVQWPEHHVYHRPATMAPFMAWEHTITTLFTTSTRPHRHRELASRIQFSTRASSETITHYGQSGLCDDST